MDITIDEPDLEIIHEDLKGKNNDDRIDNECDRIYTDELIGNRVKINYEAGWVSGTLKYFNTTLMEYNALLEDGTEDYIKEGDIDGKDIVLIDENVGEYITGKSFSEALILASTNSQYDKRLSIELSIQYMFSPCSELGIFMY